MKSSAADQHWWNEKTAEQKEQFNEQESRFIECKEDKEF